MAHQDTVTPTTTLAEKAAAAAEIEKPPENLDVPKAPIEGEEPTPPAEDPKPSEIVDIDGQDKIMFRGKEYTPEELDKSILRQSDYTRKTQSLAENRKYYDNLHYDLANVRNNPEMADQFRQIYPESFHTYLDLVENTGHQEDSDLDLESDTISGPLQKKLESMQNKIDSYDRKFQDEKIEATNARLDAVFEKLGQKYDLADEDAIVNKAQRLLEDNKANPNFELTNSAWERLFRNDHEARDTAYSSRQKRLLDAQAEQGNKGNDGGPGGVPPGRERKRLSFDEATDMAIQDLGGN